MGRKKRVGSSTENDRDILADLGSLSDKDFDTANDLPFDLDLDDEEDADEEAVDNGMSEEAAAKRVAELLSGLFEAAGHKGA